MIGIETNFLRLSRDRMSAWLCPAATVPPHTPPALRRSLKAGEKRGDMGGEASRRRRAFAAKPPEFRMNRSVSLTILLFSLAMFCVACRPVPTNNTNGVVVITPTPQQFDSPQKVALSLFEAARYTSWNRLPGLCMPDGFSERSAQDLCDVGKTADEKRTRFREEFMQGGIDGTPEIGPETAKIKIMYSKKLSKTADLTLKKVDGRWYLYSFEPK